jgi:hypothetical protein
MPALERGTLAKARRAAKTHYYTGRLQMRSTTCARVHDWQNAGHRLLLAWPQMQGVTWVSGNGQGAVQTFSRAIACECIRV